MATHVLWDHLGPKRCSPMARKRDGAERSDAAYPAVREVS